MKFVFAALTSASSMWLMNRWAAMGCSVPEKIAIVSEPFHVFWSGLWVVIRDGWLRIADTVAG